MLEYLKQFDKCYNSQDPNNSNNIYFNRNRKISSIDTTSKTVVSNLINKAILNNKYDFYNRIYSLDYPESSIDNFGTQNINKNSITIRYNHKIL